MKNKIFKYTVISICILTIILITQNAKADPILEIDIPMLGATYEYSKADGTAAFEVSGLSDVEVFYIDEITSVQYSVTYDDTFFLLDTVGLEWAISKEGKKITFSASADKGRIDLTQFLGSRLLGGSLINIEMDIIDPRLGLYEGSGIFEVWSGTDPSDPLNYGGVLAEDFGYHGGLATVGLSVRVPIDFLRPFASFASTKLYPAQASPTPEPSTLIIFTFLLIGIGWIVKKQQVKE